jgi:hypothetical protein
MRQVEDTVESTDSAAVKPRGMSAEIYCEKIDRFRDVRDRLDSSLGVDQFSVTLDADGVIEADVTLSERGPFEVLNGLLSEGVDVVNIGTGDATTSASRTRDGETVVTRFVPLKITLRVE